MTTLRLLRWFFGASMIVWILASRVPKADPAAVLPRDLPLENVLRQHVRTLSGVIGERHPGRPVSLEAAAAYVEKEMQKAGFKPFSHSFKAGGQTLRNVIAIREGKGPAVVVGAHYDSVPGSPGADDNASGTAALLGLVREARQWPAGAPIYFVAFSNEEAPNVRDMGSRRFVQDLVRRHIPVKAMIGLEMLGYYDDRVNSQHYPYFLNFFYPTTGNFVALVSNLASRPLLQRLYDPLRSVGGMKFNAAVLPAFIGGIDRSDHVNFWNADIPAIMVSDTAFYRNPHYHLSSDRHWRLDYRRLAQLTQALGRAIPAL